MILAIKKSSTDERMHTGKRLWRIPKPFLLLILASLMISFLSHLFFLAEWLDGRYMVGMNDGLSQMLPFKRLLYDSYTNGDFFYTYGFGMGGGTYSQLGYYFSTSIVFILTVIITYGLEILGIIGTPDLSFWADSVLVISIIRMTCIITITTGLFRYMNTGRIPAFVGAVIYGTSVIYFRHVQYWEFFADAMILLPILLFGIEKIIREKKAGWFIAGVAISVFDNFYFAYVNFLLAAIYIVFRWIIPFSSGEQKISKQVKQYLLGGLAGFGIGAVSFIPAVYGYLDNYRPPYDGELPLFAFPDHILLDGRIIVLPALAVILLCLFSLYKNRMFRFFASLTLLAISMHHSPLIASIFNGFSAPQYRWEYFIALVAGAMIAIFLTEIHKVASKELILSGVVAFFIYVCSFMINDLSLSSLFTFKVAYLAVPAIVTILVVIFYGIKRTNKVLSVLTVLLLVSSMFISNGYQQVKLSHAGTNNEVSKAYMVGDTYNGPETRALIEKIKESEENPLYRIDWMYPTRNNTPITQDFNGFSAYSSILNQQLLFFYYFDLDVDMGRESVSRYGTLGNRANLYSLLAGKYYITKKGDNSIPYGFEKILSEGDYIAYQNRNILPFVRTTNNVYTEEELADASPLDRERAMLDGIVLAQGHSSGKLIPQTEDLMKNVEIKPVGSTYNNGILDVKSETGGIDLIIKESNPDIKDYFVSFYLKSLDRDHFFHMSVNDYETSRKSNISFYKTEDYNMTIRVAANDVISIVVPKGKYELKNLELYGEDYRLLESVKEKYAQQAEIPLNWSGNKININYDNQNDEKYLMLPIPYEKGWQVYINGDRKEVLEANYSFIGVKLEAGLNDIKLVYYPPYFFISLWISIISLVVTLLVNWYFRKRPPWKRNKD